MRPILIRLLTGLALLSLPGLAGAQSLHPQAGSRSLHPQAGAQGLHPQAGQMCRAECMQAGNSRLGANQAQTVRACEIRCGAAMAYLANQNRRGTAEATGRGAAPRPAHPSPRPAPLAQPLVHRVQQPARTPLPVTQVATRTAASHGVIYGARTPSAAFGLAVGQADRMTAHRLAEGSCAATGPGCRMIAETTEACVAAAHGVLRSPWAIFMTSDPSSYVVTSLSAGSGRTQIVAEQQAIAECRARDPRATCRIAAAACAGRG